MSKSCIQMIEPSGIAKLNTWWENHIDTLACKPARETRNGGRHSELFPDPFVWDLQEDGFPLLTRKKVYYISAFAEMLGFLQAFDRNSQFLKQGTAVWTGNSQAPYWTTTPAAHHFNYHNDDLDSLGRIYGVQWFNWRSWNPVNNTLQTTNQMATLLKSLREDPSSTRMLVTAFNPGELHLMSLPPCHMMFQCGVEGDNLDLQMYQRSADLVLGVPFNIAAYAMLLQMLADMTGLRARKLKIVYGDFHVYAQHYADGLLDHLDVTRDSARFEGKLRLNMNWGDTDPLLANFDGTLDWVGKLKPIPIVADTGSDDFERGPIIRSPMIV